MAREERQDDRATENGHRQKAPDGSIERAARFDETLRSPRRPIISDRRSPEFRTTFGLLQATTGSNDRSARGEAHQE
ncbi:MAG TPA: hypothetical protein DCQ98_10915 [Planctomycetaceae bacterium]|nr:hypothetical protein [Planctomycetaceae bacterium]